MAFKTKNMRKKPNPNHTHLYIYKVPFIPK